MQARRGIVSRHERNLVTFAGLAHRNGDRALIGTDNGADFFLRDQALGFGAAGLRIGLVIGVDQSHLGAAKARQALATRQWQVKIVVLVDDVGRGLERILGIDADLCARTGEWIDDADCHVGRIRARCERH